MKGIIFDFNGTLFWDTKKHNEAWIEFSKQIRGFPFTEEELFKTTGQTNRLILEYIKIKSYVFKCLKKMLKTQLKLEE